MPRLSSGTSAVAVTTLFAASGAAMPSGEPLPNSSGCLDQRFASEYAMNAAIVPPAPGVTPSTVPMTVPIICGLKMRFVMAQSGSFSFAFDLATLTHSGSPICTSISVTANKPTMTRIGFTPPSKSAEPKVKRGTPDIGSLPIQAIIKPISAAITPLISEPPDRPAITDKPRMPSEK